MKARLIVDFEMEHTDNREMFNAQVKALADQLAAVGCKVAVDLFDQPEPVEKAGAD